MSESEVIFAYGSLMSAYGIKGLLRNRPSSSLNIRNAFLIWMKSGRRGFAKPSESFGPRLSMDLDEFYPLEGKIIERVTKPPNRGFIGLRLEIPAREFPKVCNREMNNREYGEKLLKIAKEQNKTVGEFLLDILRDCSANSFEDAIRKYRQKLSTVLGSSEHYIPHPVELEDGRVAVTFIAPGKYGTGSNIKSKKEEEGIFELKSVIEAFEWCSGRGSCEKFAKIFCRMFTWWSTRNILG